ncbi:hypothetical protein GQ457_16G017740 [Hibiscus cannabinus]
MEFGRLQNKERELRDLGTALENENTILRDDNRKFSDRVSKLHNTISQLRKQNRELHHKNLELQQIMNLIFNPMKIAIPNERKASIFWVFTEETNPSFHMRLLRQVSPKI